MHTIENATREDKIIKSLQLFRQAAHQVATGYNPIVIFYLVKHENIFHMHFDADYVLNML